MPQRAIRATINGRVQGVGFRWATRRVAMDLGLTGWVRNRPDGSVEALAQGDEVATDALLDFLRQGPPGAFVDSVAVEDVESTEGLSGFDITG